MCTGMNSSSKMAPTIQGVHLLAGAITRVRNPAAIEDKMARASRAIFIVRVNARSGSAAA